MCPWNVRFARTLPESSRFAAREFLAGKDARQLAQDLLELTPEEFSAAFEGSLMKRAKLRGLTLMSPLHDMDDATSIG